MHSLGLGLSGFESLSPFAQAGAPQASLFDRFPLGNSRVWRNYALVHKALAEARTQNLSPERAKNFRNAEAILARMESRSLAELFMPVQYSTLAGLALGRYS